MKQHSQDWPHPYSEQDWLGCLRVLEAASETPDQVPDLQRFKTLVSGIYKAARKQKRKDSETARTAHDEALLNATGRVQQQEPDTAHPQGDTQLLKSRFCYSCKALYQQLDSYYHRLCPDCAQLHRERRALNPDLSGRLALVTGGRIKIGHATALRLLRGGAQVYVTSRFPALATAQFAAAADYAAWRDRLQIVGLDLLHLGGLEALIAQLYDRLPHLDILINNAALTLWQAPPIYRALQQQESQARLELEPGLLANAGASKAEMALPALMLGTHAHSPQAAPDGSHNSWLLELDQVPAREMLEVMVINQVAPMMLCSQLKALMQRSPHPERWIVNVTAIEGQFSDPLKQSKHAHTNAAKAGLNMLTRTAASAYAEDGILMNAVDPGWVSVDQHALKYAQQEPRAQQIPPLHTDDAAARICAPIYDSLLGQPQWGKLFKNYEVCDW
ncbi:MAG: SDR family NAD(P)-dependent oxidoreductase [Candidatus Sericytochromatia bacterium]